MKKFTLYSLIILFVVAFSGFSGQNYVNASPKRTAVRTSTKNSRYTKYKGKIGNYNVTAYLDLNGNGYYYYGNGSRGKLTLRGVPDPSKNGAAMAFFYIYEYDSAGRNTAVWEVYIGSMAIKPGERIKVVDGEMTTSDGRTYPISLY